MEFLTLYAYGSGICILNILVNAFAILYAGALLQFILYAGALLQFIIGLIGASALCILIRPLIVGAVGFIFMYFHLSSLGIR